MPPEWVGMIMMLMVLGLASLVAGAVVVLWDGRRVGWCYLDGQDIAEALVKAGLARDCPRFSRGQYAAAETPAARGLPFPGYCRPR